MNNIAATITDDIRRLEPGDEPDLRYESPSLLTQISYATKLSALKGANASRRWYKGWQYWLHPPETGPDIVKNYDIKPILPVRYVIPSPLPHNLPSSHEKHIPSVELRPPDNVPHPPNSLYHPRRRLLHRRTLRRRHVEPHLLRRE